MTSQEKTSKTVELTDTDLLAVRRIMADGAHIEPTDRKGQAASGRHNAEMEKPAPRGQKRLPHLAQLVDSGQASREKSTRALISSVCRAVLARIRTYHPERKRILHTSLVLMLLLQPFFVIGWTFFLLGLVVALYVFWGGDLFWRRLIALYQKAERRWPEPARRLKLKAYVAGKKWDGILDRIPERLADPLRGPDLRRIATADAAHDAILSERLTRL